MGEVLLRARPRARVPATGERRFLEAWERAGRRRGSPGGRRTTTPPTSPRGGSSTGSTRGSGCPSSDGLADALAWRSDRRPGRATCARTLTPERNHRTLELYALLIVALALPALDDGLLDFAVAELHRNLLTRLPPDGVAPRGSTHYHLIALRSFVGPRENGRRYDVALPRRLRRRGSPRACDFALHCRRPDGPIPALSDADTGAYARAARARRRAARRAPGGLRTGAAQRDRRRASPTAATTCSAAADEPRRAFLILDCGPLGDGGHGHYDLLSVEAWAAAGRWWSTRAASPTRRAAEPAPLVQGHRRAQHRVRRRRSTRRRTRAGARAASARRARCSAARRAAGLDLIAAEARSPAYDAVHRRRVVFVGGEYWVVEDRLRGARPAPLRPALAPAPDAQGAATVLGGRVLAPGLALVVTGAEPVLEPGWVAPALRRAAAPRPS